MALSVSSPSFVGRERELERVSAALDQARQERPAVFLVAGEAGVGKTRFLREVSARARQSGFRILEGGCIQLGAERLPFGPIIEALRGLPEKLPPAQLRELVGTGEAELTAVLPGLRGTAEQGTATDTSQGQTFEQILLFMTRLARLAPLALLIEDVHWADRTTLEFLVFMVRNLRENPIAVVATYRADELHRRHPLVPVLAELQRSGRTERLHLERFDRLEMAEQLAGILGVEPHTDLVDTVYARSDGNAFFAEELVAAGQTDGLPDTLQELLLVRLTTLSERAQELVRVASVAGPRVGVTTLAEVTATDEPAIYAALREAVDAHVLVPLGGTDDRYAFRHALLQEAIYGDLLPGERTRLHGAFAHALGDDLGPDVDAARAAELAYHWHAAHDLPRAFEASVRAGLAADALYAAGDARTSYERALELWDKVPDAASRSPIDRVDLLVRAAFAQLSARRTASAYLRAAIDLVDPDADPSRAGLLTSYLANIYLLWDDAAALAAAREAVGRIPADPPSAARVRALISLGGVVLSNFGRHAEALPILEEALRTARAIAPRSTAAGTLEALGLDPAVPRRVESSALEYLGVALAGLGDTTGGLRHIEASREIAAHLRIDHRISETWLYESLVLLTAGRFEEAGAGALIAAEHAATHGLAGEQGSYGLIRAADALIAVGRWTEAAERLEQAERQVSDALASVFLDTKMAGFEVGRGDFGSAARRLARQRPVARQSLTTGFLALYVAAAAELALWTGDLRAARSAIRDGLPRLQAAPDIAVGDAGRVYALGIRTEADVALAARARQADDDLREAIDAGWTLVGSMRTLAADTAARRPVFSPQADAWRATCEAEFSRLEGASDPDRWAAAAEAWEALRMPYPRAYALMREAQAALAGRLDRARLAAAVREAFVIADRLGARPLLRKVEEIAARAGVRLEPEVPGADQAVGGPEARGERPRDGAPSPRDRYELTRRELEVLDLLVGGRSDGEIAAKLFISKKTVSVHVANIKGKLGAESRVEVVTTAIGRGLIETPSPGGAP